VGLLQREFERHKMSTISLTHLPELTEKMNVPRAMHIRYPMGRSLGFAGQQDRQKEIVVELLKGIYTIKKGEIKVLPYS
jgi:ABC-type polysaccharide/polyol phosphate transport system ATPase subunit